MENAISTLFENHLFEWCAQLAEGHNPYGQIPNEKVAQLHAIAYDRYQQKSFAEAAHFFRALVMTHPSEPKYWKGLGASLQMKQEYGEALDCYLAAQLLYKENPDPYLYLHAADCYFAMKEIEPGIKALNAAQKRAKEIDNRVILEHVKFMRQFWSKRS